MTPDPKGARKRARQFGILRGFALWALLTYVCVYWLARDPCLARGGVLATFVCGTDDGKVYSIVDLVGVTHVTIAAVAIAIIVVIVWGLLRKYERATGEDQD